MRIETAGSIIMSALISKKITLKKTLDEYPDSKAIESQLGFYCEVIKELESGDMYLIKSDEGEK